MFQIHRREIEWGGRTLSLETGKIARQADGAVVVTYGQTSVLCTVVAEKKPKDGVDFFPLTVHYQEKAFAAGKIPGGFFKREGKPSEKEVLTSRLIDRPIRPLFDGHFFNETQIVCTLLSHDLENDADIIAMIGASAAIAVAGLPCHGPMAAARVGYTDGAYVLNPTFQELPDSSLNLVVGATKDGVMMVESEAHQLSEEIMLGAVVYGQTEMQPVIEMIKALAADAAKTPWATPEADPEAATIEAMLSDKFEADLRLAYKETQKQVRSEKVGEVKARAVEALKEAHPELSEVKIVKFFKALEQKVVRGDILKTSKRIDGRDLVTVRPIECEVGLLPGAHGSALFTRGETQALVVATLGTSQDEQLIDALEGEYRERFMLHYNFPPFSVGEVGRMSGPGRREIGHGKLAWRALNPMMPTKEAFAYTVRVVSEITESNGSSSMATVCGGSLAMMDAGVPLTKPVAGIAMGLIKDGGSFAVLSDILGDEDHLGDMDFKVAGTEDGVTSLQMDIKVTGITKEIMEVALSQAKGGRLHILGEMAKAMTGSREGVKENAPRIESFDIKKDKIRDVIGSGGKVIREICEKTKTKIDISEEGRIEVSGPNQHSIDEAIRIIKGITEDPEVGKVYPAKVVKLMDFGAFVDYCGTRSGLVHISQLAAERVEKVDSVVKIGDDVFVKLLGFDDRGKARLSMKVVNQETGEALETAAPAQE
ncbi:MAG: polyribonucleotide nucleotidyltransferase [Alphaproteobacteria bacterium]|jgi:polyribonucleotide nucleotidyltransferase|nr:polyribonucleotide nucleotidyltransferase [Alphaproteobacteria bacterium]